MVPDMLGNHKYFMLQLYALRCASKNRNTFDPRR